MTNQELLKEMGTIHAWIERSFNLALSYKSRALKELITDDIYIEELSTLFPDISYDELEEAMQDNEVTETLVHNGKLGWLLEIAVPEHDKFTFKEEGSDAYSSCRIFEGITTHKWLYVESMDEAVAKIKEAYQEILKQQIEAFRKRVAKNEA